MFTRVYNLKTDEEKWYFLPPFMAVIAAYESARGNNNTWDYHKSKAPIVKGKYSIAAGDWCAALGEEKNSGSTSN